MNPDEYREWAHSLFLKYGIVEPMAPDEGEDE